MLIAFTVSTLAHADDKAMSLFKRSAVETERQVELINTALKLGTEHASTIELETKRGLAFIERNFGNIEKFKSSVKYKGMQRYYDIDNQETMERLSLMFATLVISADPEIKLYPSNDHSFILEFNHELIGFCRGTKDMVPCEAGKRSESKEDRFEVLLQGTLDSIPDSNGVGSATLLLTGFELVNINYFTEIVNLADEYNSIGEKHGR